MTVADFVALTRRSWRALAIAILLGLAGAAIFSAFTPPVYQSRSTGFVVAGSDGGYADALSGTQAATSKARSYIPLITSSAVFTKISEDPDLDLGGQALAGRLQASVAADSTLIEVTATASSPEGAVALANGALEALAEVIKDIETQSSATQNPSVTVVPLENALPPTAPVTPNWPINLLVGAGIGLVVGYAFVLLRRSLDVKVRTGDDLTGPLNVGLLARIPKMGKTKLGKRARVKRRGGYTATDEGVEEGVIAAEAFRQLRTSLRFSSVDHEVRSVVITSANQGEGKSTIAAALARTLAKSGQSTVIVDADLRRPTIGALLGVDSSVGLSDVLSGQVTMHDALRASDTPGLMVLPAGRIPPNPSEMIGSTAMRTLVEDLRTEFFVIVDAPPLLPVTDAALASVVVDGVILVAAAGQTRKHEVTASGSILSQVHARLLGAVLNKVTRHGGSDYYYSRKNSRYYVSAAEATKDAPPLESASNGPRVSRRGVR